MKPPELNPVIVGEWDGVHLWIQWAGRAGVRYRVRVRYREPGASKAGAWIVGAPQASDCAKIATHKHGWTAEAQVAVDGRKLNWEAAKVMRFGRSQCRFEIKSERKATFTKGQTLHCVIGGEPCSYRFLTDVEVTANGVRVETLEAVRSLPGNRLRSAGQFRIAPAFDLLIRNTGPSENDFVPVDWGRKIKVSPSGEARIVIAEPDGPMTAAFHTLPRRAV